MAITTSSPTLRPKLPSPTGKFSKGRDPEPTPDLWMTEKKKEVPKRNKGTKGTKKTHNREENVFPENSIFAKETLDEYERLAKQEGPKENVKLFMKKVYNNEEYKTRMSIPRASGSGSSTIKRGANGKNWKEGGEWICESLHYANKIYNALLKMNWVKEGKHGMQKARNEATQCVFITKNDSRCIRSSCSSSMMCTQHFNMSLK